MIHILFAILVLTLLALAFGIILGFAAVKFHVEADPIVDQLDALLPQTQCGQCGYPGCRPYAEALLQGTAGTDQCPPGGEPTACALASLLGSRSPPLMPPLSVAGLAVIDEPACIGCARCTEVCPVDAIIGAAHFSHTVIAADCTGCELCIPVCPVDCIRLDSPG